MISAERLTQKYCRKISAESKKNQKGRVVLMPPYYGRFYILIFGPVWFFLFSAEIGLHKILSSGLDETLSVDHYYLHICFWVPPSTTADVTCEWSL